MRQSIKNQNIGLSKSFIYRGEQQTRIETFSDAVFALAITLLVLSSKVPDTFEEMYISFLDLIPFAICITLLALIWWQHYIFFIRYGLKDAKTVALNLLLLFLILFYVFPLKFLFKTLTMMFYGTMTGNDLMLKELFTVILPFEYANHLMVIYGLGVVSIYAVLALMYKYAISKRTELALTEEELFETRTSYYGNLLATTPPILSVLIVLFLPYENWSFRMAGFAYWTYPLVLPFFSYYRKKKAEVRFNPAAPVMFT